jgi:hypothetical protein
MSRIPFRREHTGNAAVDRVQRTGQQAAAKLSTVEDQLLYLPAAIVLKDTFTTTRNSAAGTKLAIQVKRGDLWVMQYYGRAGVSGSVNGMSYMIAAPTGSTLQGILHSSLGAITTLAYVQLNAINTLTSAVHTVNGGFRDDWINVRVRVEADGILGLKACSTTAGDTTTILKGALAIFYRYTEV